MQEILNTSEAAAVLRVKAQTIKKYRKCGKLKPIAFVCGRPRFRFDDVMKLVTSQQKTTVNG